MAQNDSRDEVVGFLVTTAKAHHAATGGVNPRWARWYAERLVVDLNEALSADMSVDQLEEWLTAADERYRSEPQEQSWPKAYAAWLRTGFP
jgi:hypothetical protein